MTIKRGTEENAKPIAYEEVAARHVKQPKRRALDFGYLHKRSKITASYKNKKIQRISIVRQKTGRRKTGWMYWAVAAVLSIIFICSIFTGTKLYSVLILLKSIKNENILVGFQNSAELRPTGGFWGSFAYLKVGKNISNSTLSFETNPYKKDNPLLKETNASLPTPMKETWIDRPQSFVNANWPFDFPTAAKTIEWYFGQGWQLDTDAVVGISSLAVIDALKLTGPVTLGNGETITSENFTQVMSEKIDVEYWQDPKNIQINEPKMVILDIAPQIIDKVKSLPRYQLYRLITEQLEQGRIVAYFNDPKKQSLAEKIGISGISAPYRADYVSINNANLNGNKTSLNVAQSIRYSVDVNGDKVLSHLEITRNHLGGLWPEAPNRNYTRAIVPVGSKLVSASLEGKNITEQIETNEELDKTTFGFWFSTSAGEAKTANLVYELPIKREQLSSYQILLQKQPGTLSDYVDIKVLGETLYSGENDKSVLKLP